MRASLRVLLPAPEGAEKTMRRPWAPSFRLSILLPVLAQALHAGDVEQELVLLAAAILLGLLLLLLGALLLLAPAHGELDLPMDDLLHPVEGVFQVHHGADDDHVEPEQLQGQDDGEDDLDLELGFHGFPRDSPNYISLRPARQSGRGALPPARRRGIGYISARDADGYLAHRGGFLRSPDCGSRPPGQVPPLEGTPGGLGRGRDRFLGRGGLRLPGRRGP